jgi:hypothetical protein
MARNKKNKDPQQQAKETALIVEDAFRSIASKVSSLFDEAFDKTETFSKSLKKDISSALNSLAKTSALIEETMSKAKLGSLTLEDIEDIKEKRQIRLNVLASQLEIANRNMANGSEEQVKITKQLNEEYKAAVEYNKELEEELKKFGEIAEKNNKKLGVTGGIIKGLTKIPLLGNLINSEKVLKKVQKESAKEESTRTSVFKTGLKEIGSSIKHNLTDPTILTAGAFGLLVKVAKFFIDAMFGADKRITDIAKNFGISKDAAEGVYQSLTLSKDSLDTIYNTTANIVEAFLDLSRLSDFISVATTKQIESQIVLTKQFGLTNEEALDTQRLFSINNIEADKGVDITYDQIAAFYKQNKLLVDGRKVLNEVGKLSKLIQINFRGNYKELVNTVLEAKKLGFTLDQVSKVGDSLLNFEQSISSEIEAELVTGRELNLEEARRYALNNDLLGLTKEIKNQGITTEVFANMNRIQQESIAKALGLQANELADSLYKSKLIDKVGKGYTETLKKQADIAEGEGKRDEASRLRKLAISMEQGIVDGKSLEAAQKQASAQEKFEIALEKIKEIFSDLVTGGTLDYLADALNRVVTNLQKGNGLLKQFLGFGLSETEYLTEKLKDQNAELEKLNEQYAKATGYEKDRLKIEIDEKNVKLKTLQDQQQQLQIQQKQERITAYKNLPWWKKDFSDNILDLFGKNDYSVDPGVMPQMAEGGIVTKPTRALIGEAGTEAVVPLTKFYAKMDELIASNKMVAENISKGGNVYLDTTKVGTAMTVGTYKLS